MSLYLSKSIGCPTPKVNSNVNYGLWVVLMFQHGFINCNKCTFLLGDVDNRANHVHVRVRCVQDNSEPFSQFSCEPKTALKEQFSKPLKKVSLVISQSFTFIVKIKKSILNRHPIVLVQNYILLKYKSVFCSHCIFFQAGSQAFLKNNLRMASVCYYLGLPM